MNTLFYKAILPVLCPVCALLDLLGTGLRLIFGICIFIVILEFLSYPFNRMREFSLENYQYRFARNLIYSLIVIVVLTTIQGWLHILFGDVGDKIADVVCRYGFPGLVFGLLIYDLIKKLKDREM